MIMVITSAFVIMTMAAIMSRFGQHEKSTENKKREQDENNTCRHSIRLK